MSEPVIVLAPDKFKGSLNAPDVCAAMETGLRRVFPDADIRARPMADGGDGTLDAILAGGGEHRMHKVSGAEGVQRERPYGVLRDRGGDIAVIEIASVVGITDAQGMAVPVQQRTTLGLGELMRGCLDLGLRRFMIGLGGSSTNDAGAGLLHGLGVRCTNARGEDVTPLPRSLADIAHVDFAAVDSRIAQCEITVLSDVDNPLTGRRGATAVFGPQKGVRACDIDVLDAAIARFAQRAEAAAGRHVHEIPGAGAAGGLGFALLLLGGSIKPGAEVVADLIGLDAALADADWLITGEGRSDEQTLAGKAPWVAAKRARALQIPVTLIAGALDPEALPALSKVYAGAFALPDAPLSLEECIARADSLIADRTEQIARVWQSAHTRMPR